jgi:hypothetical protein
VNDVVNPWRYQSRARYRVLLWRSYEERGDGGVGEAEESRQLCAKSWSSRDPDSYSHYKRGRERLRKQAERSREEADRSAELAREEVERRREYEERYAAERKEAQTESPRDDMGKPE